MAELRQEAFRAEGPRVDTGDVPGAHRGAMELEAGFVATAVPRPDRASRRVAAPLSQGVDDTPARRQRQGQLDQSFLTTDKCILADASTTGSPPEPQSR